MYCKNCRTKISDNAVNCPKCGEPVRTKVIEVKRKYVAVLLAVFLGFWTWLYTYKTDAWKFWTNLGLSIVTIGIWAFTVGWIWPIIDVAIKDSEWYENYR
jgi:hypothetical protein